MLTGQSGKNGWLQCTDMSSVCIRNSSDILSKNPWLASSASARSESQITENFATCSVIWTHLISVSMLWKPISLQSRVFFGADTAMCSESLKFWKKLCIGLIISGLLLGSKDQNISLDPTIFVDDERFLKNYNLKIYFASLLK